MINKNKIRDTDLIKLFLDKIITEKNLSKTTIESYKSDLILFSSHLLKYKKTLINFSESNILKYFDDLALKKFEVSTRIRKISTIKQFISFLMVENLRSDDPTAKIVYPQKKNRLPYFLSEKEVESIILFLKKNSSEFKYLQLLVITEILYATGLRVSELLSLKVSSISDDFSSLLVLGKGSKERVLPVGEYAKKLLRKYVNLDKFLNYNEFHKKNSDKWLFPSRLKYISRQSFFNHLKKTAIAVGINPKNVSPHVFRHAFASHMLKNGADLKVIQYLLGHEDISTVQIYTHLNIDDTAKAIQKHPLAKALPED